MKIVYLASYEAGDNPAALAAPWIDMGLVTYYWRDLEPLPGVYELADLDRRIGLWSRAGKPLALRVVWSADGSWPHPTAKTPTPRWVFDRGAAMVVAQGTQTEVPLCFDPIYRKHAQRLIGRLAEEYDANPYLAFVDLTPGGESNPYRFSLHDSDPTLADRFAATPASDGKFYSKAGWLDAARDLVAEADGCFGETPVLCTLHKTLFSELGEYVTSSSCWTGQNGLQGDSYRNPEGPWVKAFKIWGQQVPLYFECFGPCNRQNGSLAEVLEAGLRIGADYLGCYSRDLLAPGAQETISRYR